MLGLSSLASAALGGATERLLVDLAATFSGSVDLFGSAVAEASSKSISASTFALGGNTGSISGVSLTASGLLDFGGISAARAQLKSTGASGIQRSGICGASLSISANSLSFINIQAQSGGHTATRAVSSQEFTAAPASIIEVDTVGGVESSVPFALSSNMASVASADAFGGVQADGASTSAVNVAAWSASIIRVSGLAKTDASAKAHLNGAIGISGDASAENASRANAFVASSVALSSSAAAPAKADADGSLDVSRSAFVVAEVVAEALNGGAMPLAGLGAGAVFAQAAIRQGFTKQGQASGRVASQVNTNGVFEIRAQTDADLAVDGAGAPALGLVGESVGCAKTKAGGAGVDDLSGTAGTETAIGASAQTSLVVTGQATGGLTSQSEAAGVLDILCTLDVAAMLDSAATRDIGLTGFAAAKLEAQTAVDVVTLFGGEVRGRLATHAVTEATAVVQGVATAQTTITTAANFAVTLIGRSSVSSLPPLFGQAIVGISIDGLARADASVSAATASEAGLGATATGVAPLPSTVQGAVDIAGPSETGVAIFGQFGRSIPISGAATSASGPRSKVTGALVVQGQAKIVAPCVVIAAGTVQLSGATGMRSTVAGVGRAVFETALFADGAVPLSAVARTPLALDAIAHAVAASGGTGSCLLSLSGQSAAVVTAILRTRGTVAVTPDAAGAVVAAGTARGTIDVLRALAGDADVMGDAVRQIGIDGHAAGGISVDGRALEGAFDLPAAMTAGASVSASAQGELGFAGGAVLAIDIGAGVRPGLGFAMTAAAVVGLSAAAIPAVLFGGAAGIQVAARGHAQSAHGIEIAATCATAAAGTASGALVQDLRVMAQSGVSGSGTSAIKTTRALLGTVPVTAAAARSMPLGGSGAGSVASVGNATQAELWMELATAAQTRIRADRAFAAANLGPVGEAGARVRSHGTATSGLTFTRVSLGDVAVASAALRSIALHGDAHVRVTALVAANINIEPRCLSAASSLIAVTFITQTQLSLAVSAARTTTTCRSRPARFGTRGAGIGYRAPSALRRSACPNTPQGGRLAPSLRTGRIL